MARGKVPAEIEREELGPEWKPRPDENLGTYLKRVRLMRGLTLPDVARVTAQLPPGQRVSHPYLSQIEHGQVFQPGRERLQSIADVLGIPEAWVLEKSGLMPDGTREVPRVERSPMVDMIALRAARISPAHQKLLLEMADAILKMESGSTRKGKE